MTALPFFQVDAFAERPLTGNPAAVMPLDRWLDDALLQAIAAENNLSETAFTVPSEGGDADYELRWFTPTSEVELCGHATLAAGHVLIHAEPLRFATRKAGVLTVGKRGDRLELDLPAPALREVSEPAMTSAMGISDAPAWLADGCNDAAIVELADEAAVRAVSPDFAALREIRGWRLSPPAATASRSPAGCSSPISASTRTRSPVRPMPR